MERPGGGVAMYGNWPYGTFLYGSAPHDEPPDTRPIDLMPYLPRYYQRGRIVRALQDALGAELGAVRYTFDDILQQMFVNTATWGLAIWEWQLGITTRPNRPLDWRREIIRARTQGASTTTVKMIGAIATTFSGGEVAVTEYPTEYRFMVKFIGVLGIPPNMGGFLDMLEEVKPAHLEHSIEYTYTNWAMLTGARWDEIDNITWEQLRVFKGG